MSNFVVQSNVHLSEIKGKINTLANDIANSHITGTHKTFTLNTDPTETITTDIKKEFVIQGGVDASSNSLSELNPVRVDANGTQYNSIVNSVNIAPTDSVNGELTPTQSFNVNNSKITQGEAVITSGGDGLQQVLLYGKNGSNGNLEPLETVGDRLLVDVIELSPTGPHTPTSLPSIAIHGQVEGTSGFKNLQLNAGGILKISNQNNEYLEVQGTSHAIGANSASSIEINAEGYGKVRLTVHSSSIDELLIEGSNTSGGTFMAFNSLYPSNIAIDNAGNTANMATMLIECPPSYLRLRNITGAEITLNSYHFKSFVN
jgi:hypothetical protein